MIRITDNFSIGEEELEFKFIRSGGPGGQNVNKVSTAVQLRFDTWNSMYLPDDIRLRLFRIAGKKISKDGVVTITASRFRTQEKNRKDAVERFVLLLQKAAQRPKPRKKTKPTAQSKKRRLETKRKASAKKERRRPVSVRED